MQTYLITGCAGFIGSHLCEYILINEPKSKIIGIDNFDPFYPKNLKLENLSILLNFPNFSFTEMDISNINQVYQLPKADIVFHLAAKAGVRPSILNPNEYIKANITGTQNILNWMKENEINKMIFASSSSIYGNNLTIPFTETDNVDNPISPYAFTKKACELLNYTYHSLYNLSMVNLRFFTVYGPRQRPDLAINKFVSKIINNEMIELYGDGSTARDYTYVSDIVNGIIASKELLNQNTKPIYEIFNLGNNNPLKLLDLIDLLETVLGKKAIIEFQPMQDGDVNLTFANIDKAKDKLNYQPKVDMKSGLTHFVNWKKNA